MARQKMPPDELARLWRAGATVAEIMTRFGVCRQAVRERVRRLGLPPRYKGWKPPGFSERVSRAVKLSWERRR